MKKTFIVIAMLLLVFAISCDGDNPAPGDIPSTSVPGIPESAPDQYTEVPKEQRAQVVSAILQYFPMSIFSEEEVIPLMTPPGGLNAAGTVKVTPSQTGDSNIVSFAFDNFEMTTLKETSGLDVTLWGGLQRSGTGSQDLGTFTFDIVMELKGQPSGIYHVVGSIALATQQITISLNGDPVTFTM